MPVAGFKNADALSRPSRFWLAFTHGLILFLVTALAWIICLAANPGALRALIRSLPIPGIVDIPTPGPTSLPPAITAPRAGLPAGYLALWGSYDQGQFGCSFLLELDEGRLVGISAAHATPVLSPWTQAVFRSPDGMPAARMKGQIGRGREFVKDDFATDYALWAVAVVNLPESVLRPDPRGQGAPGEGVVMFSPFNASQGGSKRLPGVVKDVSPGVIWVQMQDSFDPHGFSGCPVVSQVTGRVVGMAVAGADLHPVVIGLNPVGALVGKARLALSNP